MTKINKIIQPELPDNPDALTRLYQKCIAGGDTPVEAICKIAEMFWNDHDSTNLFYLQLQFKSVRISVIDSIEVFMIISEEDEDGLMELAKDNEEVVTLLCSDDRFSTWLLKARFKRAMESLWPEWAGKIGEVTE